MKRFTLIFLAAFIILSCTKQAPESKNQADLDKGNTSLPPVVKVVRADITEILEENGEIVPETSAEVKSRISGRIAEVLVSEGSPVKKGDVIAKIEPDLEQTKVITSLVNSLREKEIALENIRDEYEQKKQLYDKGFIARSEFQKVADSLALAEMDYNARLEEYTLFQSETGSQSNTSMEKLSILSPLTGIMLKKEVEEGELVSGESSSRSGTLLFTVANLANLNIRININEVDIYRIDIGNDADILIAANPRGSYSGKVIRISPYASDVKGIKVFPTDIRLSGADMKLRPGMSAVVRISIKAKTNVLVVPVTALFIENKKEYVLCPDDPGSAGKPTGMKKVFVKRGVNDNRNVEIVEGLAEGDSVFSDIPYALLGKNGGMIPAYNMRKEF